MAVTYDCVDVVSCGGPASESGGGGGGGDGVGEWLGVMGLGEVWLSGRLSGEFTSEGISSSVGTVAGRFVWGMG